MNKSIHKYLLLYLLFNFSLSQLISQNVNLITAKKVAENFSLININEKKSDIQLTRVYTDNNDTLLYIFSKTNGFIIISGDYSTMPVLGFSDEGTFNGNNLNPSVKYWLDGYCKQVRQIKSSKKYYPENYLWNKYLNLNILKSDNNKMASVTPMVTSKWGQGKDYNYYCPAHEASPYDGKCVTGCVATAMGMIMRYYQFPTQGKGNHAYYHPYFGTLAVDYSKETFDWSKMTDVINSKSRDAIAKLLYDCGVAVNMDYSPNSSGANPYMAYLAFTQYFNYRLTISLEDRSDTKYKADWKWKRILMDNLIEGHPVMYGGADANYGGHAWVLDGFRDSTYFHFNWGWDGSNNGYFALDKLTPGNYDFTAGQSALINIIPYNAPYCMEKRVYTDSTRTISDGSDDSDYWNNTKCDWLISPDYSKKVTLKFNSFSTEKDKDVVNVYNGENTSAPLIGSYSGSDLPPLLTAASGKMFITFSSDSENHSKGWNATYHTIHNSVKPIPTLPKTDSANVAATVKLNWNPVVTDKLIFKIQLDTVEPSGNLNTKKVIYKNFYTAKNLYFGKTYYWRVKAITSDLKDSSDWSETFHFKTINTVYKTSPANNYISVAIPSILKWNEIAGIKNYSYQIDISPYFNSPEIIKRTIQSANPKANPKNGDTLDILLNGRTYYWRVRAADSISATEWSDVGKFTVIRSLKDVPLLLSPSDSVRDLPAKVNLLWAPMDNFSYYYIEFIDLENPLKVNSIRTTANRYTADRLNFGHTYTWKVKGQGPKNNSSWSFINQFSVINNPVLKAPVNLSVNQPVSNLKLIWDSIPGATKYEIQTDTSAAFDSKNVKKYSTATGSLTVNSLDFIKKYYWRVRAMHSVDTSRWSNSFNFTTIDSHPDAPVIVSPLNNTFNQPVVNTFKWKAVMGALKYKVLIDSDYTFSKPDIYLTNKLMITVQNLIYNKQYFWKVKVITATDSSAYSGITTFYTIGSMSNKPMLLLPYNGASSLMPQILLQWSKVDQAEKYILQTDKSASFSNPVVTESSNSTLQLSNLQFGTSYFWRVAAVKDNTQTGWSDAYTFTVLNNPSCKSPADNSREQSVTATQLEWTNIKGIKQYQLQIDTSRTFGSTMLKSVNLTDSFFNPSTLLFTTGYFWRVRAITLTDTSEWSAVRSLSTVSKVHILKPAYYSANNMPVIDVVLKPVDGATQYDYRIDTAYAFNSPRLRTDSTFGLSDFRIKNLMFGAMYYIKFRARNAASSTLWSAPVSFSICNSFAQLSPDDNAKDQMPDVKLSWENINGAIQYLYEIDITGDFNSDKIVRTNCTDNIIYNSKALRFGTKYFWRVQAQSTSTDMPIVTGFRSFWTVDTVVALSPANNFSLGSNTQITFSWKPVTGIKKYELQYDSSATFANPSINYINFPNTKATFKGFVPGTDYFWRIRAISDYPDTTHWSRVMQILSVSNISADNYFSLSPNPANNNISIIIKGNYKGNTIVNIHNLTGEIVRSEKLSYYADSKINLDISALKPGLYLIEVSTDKGSFYRKLIKQ